MDGQLMCSSIEKAKYVICDLTINVSNYEIIANFTYKLVV